MKPTFHPTSASLLGLSRLLVRGFSAGLLAFAPAAWAVTETFDSPGTTTWEVPPGITSITVECRGGGGAGGAALRPVNANVRGGGGAGGSYARQVINVLEGQQYSITVGAGGISSIDGVTDGSVLPTQNGGDSSFAALVVAKGGAGGQNGVTSLTGVAVNRAGGTGSVDGCVGDASTFQRGGNGGTASGGGTGAGGGGAGDSNPGGDANGATAGLAGVAGGGDGAAGVANNFNGSNGAAPGGGGSGGSRTTITGSSSIGGNGGDGAVSITYAANTGVTNYVVTTANTSVTAGDIFDVTITAKDNSNNTVPDSTNEVVITSPTSGSLMEFDWDKDGTFGDNSGTLNAGVKTIKARNKKAETVDIVASTGPITTTSPLSLTTNAGAFTKLQILAPGETAAPGTDTGKTGTPTNRAAGVAFDVTVNAVDEFWNLASAVTDTVSLSSSDTIATLPLPTALVDSTVLLPVTFNSPGPQTITATDDSDGTKTADTTPDISVNAVARVWVGDGVDNQWDTVSSNWDTVPATDPTTPTTYADNNAATFSALGLSNAEVDITGTVLPFSISAGAGDSTYVLGSTSGGSIGGALGGGLTKTGTGTLTLATSNSYSGVTVVNGGLLLLTNSSALPANSALTLNGGILGLGAGDFTRALGTGPGELALTGQNGGFAAFGANRFVNLGAAGDEVTWGSDGFFNASNSNTLVLGHVTATHTLDFQNPINMGSSNRTFNVADGEASLDAKLSGAITGSGNFVKGGAGTLELSSTGNAWTGTTQITSGTLRLAASDVLPNVNLIISRANGAPSEATVDLAGFSDTVNNLTLGADNATNGQTPSLINTGDPNAVLTLSANVQYFGGAGTPTGQATVSANLNVGGTRLFNIRDSSITDEELIVSGETTGGNITKAEAGTLVLTNPKYTGFTTVNTGTLIIRKVGTQTNANPNNDASSVTVADGAKLDLDYTGTDVVSSVTLGFDPAFTTGEISSATHPDYITGTGTLTIIFDPYLIWAGPGNDFDGDANNDGVKNGVAWLLGALGPNGNALGRLPKVTQTVDGLKMNFEMLPVAARDGAALYLEYSTNLATWSLGEIVPDAGEDTAPVTFVVGDIEPANGLPDVEATVSSSEADGGKLFGRLRAER